VPDDVTDDIVQTLAADLWEVVFGSRSEAADALG
jgi:hypothetical protein